MYEGPRWPLWGPADAMPLHLCPVWSLFIYLFIWCFNFHLKSSLQFFSVLIHLVYPFCILKPTPTSTQWVPYYLGKYPDQNVRMLSHARHKTITKRRTRWLVPSSPARRSHAASRLFIAFKIFFDCSLITSLIIAIICMLYLFSQHVVPALTKCRLARHNS